MNPDTVRRYGRIARWFHAGIYLTVLALLVGGWWFLTVGYSRSSPLSALTGLPDGELHEFAGYGMLLVVLAWLLLGARGVRMFVRETLRVERGDGRWLVRLPRAAFTGRFPAHGGHFDPGQRLANMAMLASLTALAGSGLGMLYLPNGQLAIAAADVHRWATYLFTPVVVGHIVIAAGVLPGYRGVWRSMHLGGRLPTDVARRLWPGWLVQYLKR